VLVAAAALEALHVPLALAAAPALRTDVGQWLAQEPGPGAVAVLPLGLDTDATPAMVQSLEHQRSIVNGYSGQRPDFYRPLAETINTFPSRDALAALHDARVRFVVTGEPIEPTETAEPYKERARFSDGTIYELLWTPELETRLAATAVIEPPSPGNVPFRVGEVARYTVGWGGRVDEPFRRRDLHRRRAARIPVRRQGGDRAVGGAVLRGAGRVRDARGCGPAAAGARARSERGVASRDARRSSSTTSRTSSGPGVRSRTPMRTAR
jgi:hypothetical protein